MPPRAQPKTIRDQLRVLRRNAWLLLLLTVLAAGAAVGLSVKQKKEYTVDGVMNFVDPIRDAGIVGGQASNTAAATFAATGVARITQTFTLTQVEQTLGTKTSVAALRSAITTAVDPNTNLVTITAKGASASFVANLVNTVMDKTKLDADAEAAAYFAKIAAQYQAQLNALPPGERANSLTTSALEDNLARAEVIANGGATAAQIDTRPAPPSSPTSPKPVADGIVGGILGLILGLCIAAVRESLDRRLRGSKEIEAALKLPLLGHIREESLGRIASVTDGIARIADADFEAFRMLRANLEFLDRINRVRTVAVTSALPQEGKTTVAFALACASAVAGRRTLLVECDMRRPTMSARFGLSQGSGLSDFLAGDAEPEEIVQSLSVGSQLAATGDEAEQDDRTLGVLACITAGSPNRRPAELLASNRFKEFLAEVALVYDLVVLDTCPVLPVADTLEVVPNVDALLFCVRASRTAREEALAGKAAIDRFEARPMGVVVTGARDHGEEKLYYSAYTYASSAKAGKA